jgi:hypothetical protein
MDAPNRVCDSWRLLVVSRVFMTQSLFPELPAFKEEFELEELMQFSQGMIATHVFP